MIASRVLRRMSSLAVTTAMVVAASCGTDRSFRNHENEAGAGGSGGYAGTNSIGGTRGGEGSAGHSGTASTEAGSPGEGGAPNGGSPEGGSGNESTDCPQTFRCEANVLERCKSGGDWVVQTACSPPNGVCNATLGACVNTKVSGSFVSLGVFTATGKARISDGQLFLSPISCNSAKTACVRGGFLP